MYRSASVVAVTRLVSPAQRAWLDTAAWAVCGSCEITVVDGEPEHRDDIGAPPGCTYACVSRAKSHRSSWTSEHAAAAREVSECG